MTARTSDEKKMYEVTLLLVKIAQGKSVTGAEAIFVVFDNPIPDELMKALESKLSTTPRPYSVIQMPSLANELAAGNYFRGPLIDVKLGNQTAYRRTSPDWAQKPSTVFIRNFPEVALAMDDSQLHATASAMLALRDRALDKESDKDVFDTNSTILLMAERDVYQSLAKRFMKINWHHRLWNTLNFELGKELEPDELKR